MKCKVSNHLYTLVYVSQRLDYFNKKKITYTTVRSSRCSTPFLHSSNPFRTCIVHCWRQNKILSPEKHSLIHCQTKVYQRHFDLKFNSAFKTTVFTFFQSEIL